MCKLINIKRALNEIGLVVQFQGDIGDTRKHSVGIFGITCLGIAACPENCPAVAHQLNLRKISDCCEGI